MCIQYILVIEQVNRVSNLIMSNVYYIRLNEKNNNKNYTRLLVYYVAGRSDNNINQHSSLIFISTRIFENSFRPLASHIKGTSRR